MPTTHGAPAPHGVPTAHGVRATHGVPEAHQVPTAEGAATRHGVPATHGCPQRMARRQRMDCPQPMGCAQQMACPERMGCPQPMVSVTDDMPTSHAAPAAAAARGVTSCHGAPGAAAAHAVCANHGVPATHGAPEAHSAPAIRGVLATHAVPTTHGATAGQWGGANLGPPAREAEAPPAPPPLIRELGGGEAAAAPAERRVGGWSGSRPCAMDGRSGDRTGARSDCRCPSGSRARRQSDGRPTGRPPKACRAPTLHTLGLGMSHEFGAVCRRSPTCKDTQQMLCKRSGTARSGMEKARTRANNTYKSSRIGAGNPWNSDPTYCAHFCLKCLGIVWHELAQPRPRNWSSRLGPSPTCHKRSTGSAAVFVQLVGP